MGGFVAEALRDDKEMQIIAGVDKFNNSQSFPVFKIFNEIRFIFSLSFVSNNSFSILLLRSNTNSLI